MTKLMTPVSTVASSTSVVDMDVDTHRILKLVCQFSMRSPGCSAKEKEVIIPMDMSALAQRSGKFYSELLKSVVAIVTRCAGGGVTDLEYEKDVIFYYIDAYGDRVWVSSPTAFSAFYKSHETMADLKLFACGEYHMQKLCSMAEKK